MDKRPKNMENKIAMLFGFLFAHHSRADTKTPLTQTQIEEMTGWDQVSVGRWMKHAFEDGMKGYKQALVSGNLKKGYVQRFPNGHSLVDGIVEDIQNLDDVDEVD